MFVCSRDDPVRLIGIAICHLRHAPFIGGDIFSTSHLDVQLVIVSQGRHSLAHSIPHLYTAMCTTLPHTFSYFSINFSFAIEVKA